jgi:bifunctional DNA-binding transcriptional regulator/antitoxin component of YhaV-PrlF toxin-antitoxin module
MVRREHSIQFDVEVDDNGNVVLPASVVERLRAKPGSKLHLRLTSEKLNAALIQRMVTEEEVERIGRIQLEERDKVLRFLSAEGRLAKNKKFHRRAGGFSH